MQGLALAVAISTSLHQFIEDNSPVYAWTYPDAELVGQPKFENLVITHPKVAVMPDDELQDIRKTTRSRVEAFYSSDTATIYLSDRIDLDTAYGQSVLLHELVHHVQHQMDLDGIACGWSFLEGDAYTVQAAYLEEHGIDDATLKGIVGASAMHNSVGERCLLELIMNGNEP